MSASGSPITRSTVPTSLPSLERTVQPRSTTFHETGSAIGASGRPPAGAQERALRAHRVDVAEHAHDPDVTADLRLVEPGEAAADHAGGGPVAAPARAAEAEAGPARRLGRVERGAEQRGALEVGARVEVELDHEVAPVRGQRRERRPPLGRERRPGHLRRRVRLARREQRQLAVADLPVDAPEEASSGLGSDASAAADREADRVGGQAGARRREQCGGALPLPLRPDAEAQPRLAPARIQAALDALPLLDEAHGANRTLRPVAKVEQRASLAKSELVDVLRQMLLIRRFEEKVEERFRAGELPGFLHVAIGQEACAVGVCRALEDGDVIASTHRAHGHTLAKGTHPNELMAELYGKVEGCSHGYGGSMHLYDVERGNLGANAVIGGGLPQITGAGLAFKMRDEPRVAVAFFGDGATNIGTFHESLNLAQLWHTKTVFVCENNHWAESTPGWQHSQVWDDMSKRALAYDMRSIKADGRDVGAVYEAALEALEHARSGEGPVFLDVETARMHGHYIGDPQVYRSKEDREQAAHADPIEHLRDRLGVPDDDFETFDREAREVVDAAV